MKYDYIFIGGGFSALMSAYRIKQNNPAATIGILEKGKPLSERICPAKDKSCLHCKTCHIVSGISGGGAKNDGKYILPTMDSIADYGGWLSEYLSTENVYEYIHQVDDILVGFAEKEYPLYQPSLEFKQECLKHDLHLSTAVIRHYGSDGNYQVMSNLVKHLEKSGVSFFTSVEIENIDLDEKLIESSDKVWRYEKLIIAVGRTGSPWFIDFCNKHEIPLTNNRVDLGVRVEIPSEICYDIAKTIYEPKIRYRSMKYQDSTRTFCWNNGDAKVCIENNEGVLSVNGFSNSSSNENTGNSNFALLTSISFTTPFENSTQYARNIASLSNMISGGNVLVQRLGDLKLGKRSSQHRINQSTTKPTLKSAVAGDISLAMPKRILDDIIETLDALNNVIKGINNYDTLLYSPEIKTYSARPRFLDNKFQIIKDVYNLGDCSGVSRSLSQAGAMGIYLADKLTEGN